MNAPANINIVEVVAQEIRDILGDDFDDQTFLDTLDGETGVMGILGKLIEDRLESDMFAEACDRASKEYSNRSKRLQDRSKAMSAAMGKLLDAMGQKRVQHALATVSRTKGRASLSVYDDDAIPSQLRIVSTRPDKTAIKKSIEAGEDVPGAEITMGSPGVMVRIA